MFAGFYCLCRLTERSIFALTVRWSIAKLSGYGIMNFTVEREMLLRAGSCSYLEPLEPFDRKFCYPGIRNTGEVISQVITHLAPNSEDGTPPSRDK
jgi:hypothetical protein